MPVAVGFYDDILAARADGVVAEAVELLIRGDPTIAVGGRRYQVVIVAAPAGAGKTEFVCNVVDVATQINPGRPGTIAIATPTNDQAYELVRRIAIRIGPTRNVAFVPAQDRSLPTAT